MSPIDPAYDVPFPYYRQTGSFFQPVAVPSLGPFEGTLVALPCVNPDWLRILLGAADQLRNPSTWAGLTPTQTVAVLEQVEDLRAALSVAGTCVICPEIRLQDCVLQFSCDGGATWTDVTGWSENFATCVSGVIIPPIPPNPGDLIPSQRACNLAGFIAKDVVQVVIQKAVANFHDDLTLLEFGLAVFATIAFAFPITAIAADVFYAVYLEINSMNIADFEAAATDPVLVSVLTCAIYEAIKATGYITAGNLAALISNVCSMSYTYADVVTAICTFFTNIGLQNLEAMQNVGALDSVDCSGCDSWCNTWASGHTPICGGDWVVVPGGFGTCAADQWTGGNAGSFFDLAIGFTPAAPFTVTAWDISGGFASYTHIKFYDAPGGTLLGDEGATVGTTAPLLVGYVVIDWENVGLAPVINSITLSGPGSSPLGANSC